MELSTRLRNLRLLKNLRQSDVSDLTGYTQVVISQWESGSRVPSPDAIAALSKIYKVPAKNLLLLRPNRYKALILRQLEGMAEEKLKSVYEYLVRR